MKTTVTIDVLKLNIERLYQEMLVRPQMYCPKLSIESYILAIEHVLDLCSGSERTDSYSSFLREKRFGMFFFESKFTSLRKCVHTFVESTEITEEMSNLTDDYIDQFNAHWSEFLEWRKHG